MTLAEIRDILEAKVYACEELLDKEVKYGCASDMISDILAFATPGSVLLTGIVSPQIVKVGKILDLAGIVIVRGKEPLPETVDKAKEENIPLLKTRYFLFDACGKLYERGLRGV
ncbi:MAG: hypothetical protein NZ900_06335 [Synergistetes bacterium]|nr:hypothetical protein [Synergistota bacterium]MDW8192542.1 hypothetical protein [Synergistota bacterium]